MPALITHAFVLGAGLGTRLRPLTEHLPKPLVPVRNRPLITHCFDHIIHDLGVKHFLVNTHHCHEAYPRQFPDGHYESASVQFRHEPILLETAGGLDNIRDWAPQDAPLLVYNGDNLSNLPLAPLIEQHQSSGDAVTLLLRRQGNELRVGYDPDTAKVTDMRGLLGNPAPLLCQFTGIYVVSPEFFQWLQPGKIESVVFPLVEAIRAGSRVGGLVVDQGQWSDLGDRDGYLSVLDLETTRLDGTPDSRIHPSATISPSATIDDLTQIGANAVIGDDCHLKECVLWDDAFVEPGARLERCIIRQGQRAGGCHTNRDW